MTDTLYGIIGTVSIGGSSITNLRFADDIDVLAGIDQELRQLVRILEKLIDYGMEINVDKTKIMINNPVGVITSIKVNNQAIEEVQNFIYIGATLSKEGSRPAIISRMSQATAVLTKLKTIWKEKYIAVKSKILPLTYFIHISLCM